LRVCTIDAVVVVLVVVIVLFALLGYAGFRWTRPRAAAPDLRRADDAESNPPTTQELQERIGESFGQTRPPGI